MHMNWKTRFMFESSCFIQHVNRYVIVFICRRLATPKRIVKVRRFFKSFGIKINEEQGNIKVH